MARGWPRVERESSIPARYCQFTEILVSRNARSETIRPRVRLFRDGIKFLSRRLSFPVYVEWFVYGCELVKSVRSVTAMNIGKEYRFNFAETVEEVKFIIRTRGIFIWKNAFIFRERCVTPSVDFDKNNTYANGGKEEGVEQARQSANRSGRTATSAS